MGKVRMTFTLDEDVAVLIRDASAKTGVSQARIVTNGATDEANRLISFSESYESSKVDVV